MILTALATAAVTMTVTRSSLFGPLRDYLGWKIFRCPYCLVHWVAFAFALNLDGNYIINVFALVALSIIPMFLIDIYLEYIDA